MIDVATSPRNPVGRPPHRFLAFSNELQQKLIGSPQICRKSYYIAGIIGFWKRWLTVPGTCNPLHKLTNKVFLFPMSSATWELNHRECPSGLTPFAPAQKTHPGGEGSRFYWILLREAVSPNSFLQGLWSNFDDSYQISSVPKFLFQLRSPKVIQQLQNKRPLPEPAPAPATAAATATTTTTFTHTGGLTTTMSPHNPHLVWLFGFVATVAHYTKAMSHPSAAGSEGSEIGWKNFGKIRFAWQIMVGKGKSARCCTVFPRRWCLTAENSKNHPANPR